MGTKSGVQTATLTNIGGAALTINGSFAINGPFAFGGTGTCATTLAPGASCTVSVVFTPITNGTATGAVTLNDSAGTQAIALSGAGVMVASTLPAILTFPSVKVGATSVVKYSTVTNNGASTLTFTGSFTISGPFSFGGMGTCASSLAPGASCTVSVNFKPTIKGTASGKVTLSDGAGTQTIALSGTGR